MQKVLAERVIKDFCRQYLRGRTPNPCVRCNQYVKFDALLKKSIALGARFMATGHYAKVSRQKKYFLHKANDLRKDQSYFLYRIGQRQLKHLIFPLGDYTKEEVRALARKFALPVSDKVDSQEICFIPKMSYREFLREHCLECAGTGEVVDKTGKILGRHQGIPYYTLGQRGGLGIAAGYPLYVTNIDARRNRITVGKRDDAYARQFMVGKTHFVSSLIKKKVVLQVKIRYNHKEEKALISPSGSNLKVVFQKPQFAITPGQSAVFYDGDIVVGGGIIERVLN
jgi:tRNA-specific 2-thiouridylase